ncbi:glycosyltransferase family 31 protein [Bipolaris oryzae ATCC 44560]|uniref:Glycosyltransferase family 31 protein n=1 Tax=Bipolaris oryzae ATCC 44560 TaxID=930090 RepID=W6ZQJ2_COCMI|nr:glycosyltransferase family 31 protein [Bipolaris oryzae ATCC 44560]EUC45971.1 glycosyltransferase family 31 protein [Bipolaris oryzae ATCC 44560]
MPTVTPSRLAIVVIAFSLLTFFWSFGLPSQNAQPEVPVIDHYEHKNVHTEPIIPPPAIETPANVHNKPGEKGHAATPSPSTTGVAEFEEDGGRWQDANNGIATPSTLLTHTIAAHKSAAVDNSDNEPTPAAVAPPSTQAVEEHCQNLAMAQDVMVVLKTSKASIEKLNAHLRTLISCVPTFAIFSDHEGEFEGHKVYDALKAVSHEIKSSHDEFHEYRIMRADAQHKPDAAKLDELDKWKMLPMVYQAYHMNTHARFMVFIEEETALSWTNLLQWIARLDYRIPYYSGAPAYISGTQTAQRGPGILLSQGALRRFAKSYDEQYTRKWEPAVDNECCGDLMLARAMADAHVELYSSWPLLQAEQPYSLDYTKRHWCAPAVSWHKVSGDQLTRQWEIEKKWTSTKGWKTPYLFRDAYQDHVAPHVEARKEGWDNLSHDAKIVAAEGRQQQIKDEAQKAKQNQEEEEKKKQEALKESQRESDSEPDREPDLPGVVKPEHPEKDKAEDPEHLMKDHKDDILQTAGTHTTHPQKREDKKKEGEKKEPPNWDKLADKHPNAADSPEACQKTCEQIEDCLQWRYSNHGDGECHLSKVIRLGGSIGDGRWTSGWMTDKIESVKREWECKEVKWRFYQ